VLARRTIVIAVSAVCLIGVLAGCSDADSDEPPDSGLPSKSEASSPSPTTPTSEPSPTGPTGPSAPELPAAAKKHTKAGAIAFVRYYLDLLNYATHTGDVGPINRYSQDDCVGCQDDARFYEALYARGGWAKGLHRGVHRVTGSAPARPEDVYIGIEMNRTSGSYQLRRGAKTQTLPREQSRLDFYLVWVQGHWMIGRVERPA
jgi:Family of unknown function (DUF6318)